MEMPIALTFNEPAVLYLDQLGLQDFQLPKSQMAVVPVIGDTVWLDPKEPRLMFTVVGRTFTISPYGVAQIELELGLLA